MRVLFSPITTFFAFDAQGRLTKEWGANYPVEYGYDGYGQLHTLKTWRDAVDGEGGGCYRPN
jgi:YD repeat-containing protein